jgi:hypothetical protein
VLSRLLLLAGLAVAVVSAAGAASAGERSGRQVAFAPAAHRNPPLLINHGWAHKPLRIISFVPSNYPNVAGLQDFGNGVAQSKWLFNFTRAYGIPNGTEAVGYRVNDMPKLKSNSTGATYQAWVWKKMLKLGIKAAPGRQTIFLLYIPCAAPQGLDGFGCVSHHPSIQPMASEPRFTNLDSMAVVLGSPSWPTDEKTMTASHELAEAATDTGSTGWYLQTAHPHQPWLDISPWVEDEGSGHVEVADMAAGSRWVEHFFSSTLPADTTYAYVRIYADRRSSLGGDPAVPASPRAYYDVSAKQDWYRVDAGKSKTVLLTGWSTKQIPAWKVTADVISWEGSKAATAHDPCKLVGKSRWSVANGGSLQLDVGAAKRSAGKWCVVQLQSAAAPTPDGDTSHPWYVGFHIT